MSVSANYAPLNQCEFNTESESEGEAMVELGNTLDVSGLHSCSCKHPSMSDHGEYTTNANTVDSTLENISFLQSESKQMSVPRRIAFTASIFLCVFGVIYFLIGIPCSDSCVLNKPNERTYDDLFSYQMPYNDIELTGAIQVVDGTTVHGKNLIVMYIGNHMKAVDKKDISNTNGVLQLVGTTGMVGWYISEPRIPTEINCHGFLINLNNETACIVSGTKGFLAAVNPVQGGYYWYIGRNSQSLLKKVSEIDFPLKIPDMDDDLISDLLVVTTIDPNKYHNTLVIISMRSGDLIGSPWALQCQVVTLMTVLNTKIDYSCTTDGNETKKTLTLDDLRSHMILNTAQSLSNTTENENVTIIRKNGLDKMVGIARLTLQNGNGVLYMENDGNCPQVCGLVLNLTLATLTKNVTWSYKASHAYALNPTPFTFSRKNRKTKARVYLEGFIVKIWHWSKEIHVYKEKTHFDELVFNQENNSPKTGSDSKSKKLNISSLFPFVKHTQFLVDQLSETILVIAYDRDQILHANMSQVDIILLCSLGEDKDVYTHRPQCQPHLNHQVQSLSIADLDMNKFPEIISYYNTFVPPDESGGKNGSWRLVSSVRAVRMDTELPKLFPNYLTN